MTTVLARGRLLSALLVATLLLVGAGCGSDDDDGGGGSSASADFCDQLKSVQDDLEAAGEQTDPANLSAAFVQGRDALQDVDPPAEIADDWKTMVDLFSQAAGLFDGVDVEDPESLTKIQDGLAKLQEREADVEQATKNIDAYAEEECGFKISTTSTTGG